jgi:glucans biosynthesis protein
MAENRHQPHVPGWQAGLDAARAAPRCGARRRRDGQPCKGPAMPNGRCRFHGGRSPGAPRGKRNGNYKHGRRTTDAVIERRMCRRLLRQVREAVAALGPKMR